MLASYWGDVPANRGLYYNNDQQIGQALFGLINGKKIPNVITVKSESQSVADGAIMHLSTMLAEFFEVQTEVFWFIGYPDSTFRDVGVSIRKFLLQLWQKQDIRIIGEKEFIALSYEISSSADPQEYFRLNLAALASRIPNLSILLVVDLQQTFGGAYKDIYTLINQFIDWTNKKKWTGAIVVFNSSSSVKSDIKFTAPSGELINLLDSYRTQGRPVATSISTDNDMADAAHFIHPLILLGQPAQRTVLNYIMDHYPQAQKDLQSLLIKKDALWLLNGDAVRVSPRSIAFHSKNFPQDSKNALNDTIPNGAKILTFQGADRLMPQFTGLDDINMMSKAATRLVDLFALAVGQKKKEDKYFKDTIKQLISDIRNQDDTHHIFNENHSKSIIYYASQMLLTEARQFGWDFFLLLEHLTYAYADSIRLSKYNSISSSFEASRWVTNLGFVYNKIYNILPPQVKVNSGKIYDKAASYLFNLNPDDKREWANVRYAEAWHLRDAGKKELSTKMFLSSAEDIIDFIKQSNFFDETFNIIAEELILSGIVITPNVFINEKVRNFLINSLENHGSSLDFHEIINGISNEEILVDQPGVVNGLKHDFVIISSYYDLHIALLAAKGLRCKFNRLPKVILLPENKNAEIKAYINQIDAIIIGGPDTPGLSEFISSYDFEIVRLYSMKIVNDFVINTNISKQFPWLHVLSADGLLGNFEAWGMFIERQFENIIKPERNLMDQVIFEFLIQPLISVAEGRIFDSLINAIGKRIKRKKDETIKTLESFKGINDEKAKEVLAHVDADVKTVLMETSTPEAIAYVLDEVMQSLRSVNLDLQQLLSIASLSYDLAVKTHRNMQTGSAEEIKLSLYIQGFRDRRSDADQLLQEYKVTSDIDKKRLNETAEKLAKILHNFKKSAGDNFCS